MPDYSKGILVLTANEDTKPVTDEAVQPAYFSLENNFRRSQLLSLLKRKNIIADEDVNNIAIVGECNTANCFMLYYYIGLDYYIYTARMNPKHEVLDSNQHLTTHTEAERQHCIECWISTYEFKEAIKAAGRNADDISFWNPIQNNNDESATGNKFEKL